MNGEVTRSYAERINRVCDFIGEHLDEDLSVDLLSRVAHFSRYHFHRQFSDYTGITVTKYILMRRLKRASYQLVFDREYRIIDIAMDARFENPESFSRAFKKVFGQTPSQFRQAPRWDAWNEKCLLPDIERKTHMNVQIVEFTATRVALLQHRGSPALVNDSVSRFIEWRKHSRLSPVASSKSFGIAYDDPRSTEPDKFRFDICGSVEEEVPDNEQGVINSMIPAGRCAMIRHQGPHEDMDDKIRALYGQWLPQSGETLRDFPCYFHYLNFFPQVAEHELITDIYLPLE